MVPGSSYLFPSDRRVEPILWLWKLPAEVTCAHFFTAVFQKGRKMVTMGQMELFTFLKPMEGI
ncbi:hypothetical protein GCM10008938_51730 [Deinococcus roseus]|uniref:Uncharacterized protein n=1 Tax=Deinococcus roseus TaxID=392414 RepID=A0ABQ2DIX6_9DEIO|nr:hypothetical protein GCM10008938_51730 [Deinococcus roseus]